MSCCKIVLIMEKLSAPTRKPINQRALLRAVSSSTALETGQSVSQLEQKLQQLQKQKRFSHIKLAR